MIAQCTSAVKVKLDMDNNLSIFFTVTATSLPRGSYLRIVTDDKLQAYSCFDSMDRMFLILNGVGTEKILNVLKMTRKDPTYDSKIQMQEL